MLREAAETVRETQKTTLERAFELAREGKCRSVGEVILRLNREGYMGTEIQGRALRTQLKRLIKEAADSK